MQTTIKISDSKASRWAALIIVSITMMMGYFLTDAMSPLMEALEKNVGWSSSDFGAFNWSYMWFNVFLFFLIFGGIILDKFGVRITGIGACTLMIAGAFIKYYAVEYVEPGGEAIILGLNAQVFIACLGYATFAVGCEICGITVSKAINKWFTGHELALAMGFQVAVARLGTALAMIFSPIIVKHFTVSTPLLFSGVLLCIGLMVYLCFCVMDRKLDKQLGAESASADSDDNFKASDLKIIISNKGFWLIALLCLMFYSAVFPFLKFAASLMVNKYGIPSEYAGWIPSLLPLGNILMTPLFGRIYDKKGHGVTIMIIGSILLVAVHLLFAIPLLNEWWFAAFVILILGIAFSLVPSAMWPSVPKIIPQKQLGSAYALIFWVQNIGLGFVPLLIGLILDKWCVIGKHIEDSKEVTDYNYTLPMLIFAMFGVIAIILAFLLKKEDKAKNYGIEVKH